MPQPATNSRPQARSTATRDRIERSALDVFSEMGFDGASTRAIAGRAGVKPQLITYHYGTKLDLWRATVDRAFGEFAERMGARLKGLEGVDRATRVRLLLREFMLFSAETPEVARFMMHEGTQTGPRLTWLYERHIRSFTDKLLEEIAWAQGNQLAPEGDPAHLLYLVLGAVGMFSHRAEAELVTGGRSREPESFQAYVELVLSLVLPGVPSPPE